MLKLAGSILVITVSVLYGWQVRRELQEHEGNVFNVVGGDFLY